MRLSKNFTLKELIKSETATRKGINNNPNEDHIENLQKVKSMQMFRKDVKRAIQGDRIGILVTDI